MSKTEYFPLLFCVGATPLEKVIALYPYTAQNSDELTFGKDDQITVISKDEPDWWKGQLGSATGMFPVNYVQNIQESGQCKLNANIFWSKWSISQMTVEKFSSLCHTFFTHLFAFLLRLGLCNLKSIFCTLLWPHLLECLKNSLQNELFVVFLGGPMWIWESSANFGNHPVSCA